MPPAAAVVSSSPIQNQSPGIEPSLQEAADVSKDPSVQVAEPAAPVLVNHPDPTPASAANIVVAQGTTLTENGPPATIGGKAALYSSGSVYVDSTPVAVHTNVPVSPTKAVVAQGQTLTEGGPSASIGGEAAVYSAGPVFLDSSTPVAVPESQNNDVVVAHGQTLTENGAIASIGGKAAVYSAGSLYYDSTLIPIPKASSTNVFVAQGQTLSENGPSVVVDGNAAVYKAGFLFYDSTPVAVPTAAQGQQAPPAVVVAGITFAPTAQPPSPVVITFVPAVEKASHVVAGGITFALGLQPTAGDANGPVVAGGITFQPSHVRSPDDAVAPETPAPLSVGSDPVLKAANGGLLIAGSTISQGSTTSMLGHVIAANSDNVVVDGTTHSLAPATAFPIEKPTATSLQIASRPVLKAANGGLVIAGNTVTPGSSTSLLGHTISVGFNKVIVDGATHAFGPMTAYPLATLAPLEIANHPVIKAADGGLVTAGTRIRQGSKTSLFGHVISVGNDEVVDDGKTLTFASNTEAAGQQLVASPIYGSSNIVTALNLGATYTSGGHIATYTGSTPSVLTEAVSSVIGTTIVPLKPSALPNQFFVEEPVSVTPEQLYVQTSSSGVEYVLKGTTATAAMPSDVPIGGLILAGFNAAPTNSSVLPSVMVMNGTVASNTTSRVGSSPSFSSEPSSMVSPSAPGLAMGARVASCWVWRPRDCFVVLGYIVGFALIVY